MKTARWLCAAFSLVAVPLLAQDADVTGTWSGTYTLTEKQECPRTETNVSSAAFLQTGTDVTGYVVLSDVPVDVTRPPECKVTKREAVVLPIRGTVSSNSFSGFITIPDDVPFDQAFSTSVNGETMSIGVGDSQFTLTVSITRTSKTRPDLGLTGRYAGSFTETFSPCRRLPPITNSGILSATLTQVGQVVTGSVFVKGAKRDRDVMGTCIIEDDEDGVAQLRATLTGNSLAGVFLEHGSPIPFTATVSGNTITGSARGEDNNDDVTFSFTLTRTTTGPGPGPVNAPSISSFTANPSSLSAGQTSTLSWSTRNATSVSIDNGVGSVSTSGSFSVSPTQTTTYTLTASGSGGQATARITVTVASGGAARVTISAFPRGLLQAVGEGGAVDSFSLANLGDASTTLSLTPNGTFFTISPTSLVLGPGDAATVTISGNAQPAGSYEGTVSISGSGASGVVVPVRLLSVVPTTARVVAAPEIARAELSAPPGQQTSSGSIAFTNSGAGTLTALAVADVPFITPQAGPISIGPGETKSVSYTVDNARRPDSSSPLGAAIGKISLTFFSGATGVSAFADNPPPPSSSVNVTLAHVVRPGVAAGSPPPIPSGQTALFIPGVSNRSRAIGDLLLANRQSSPVTDLRIFFTGGGVPAQVASIAQLAPDRSIGLPGLVKNVFSSNVATGTAQIRTSDVSRIAIGAIQSNTSSPVGTYATALPVFRSDRGVGSPGQIVLSGLTKSATAKTDMFVQEVGGNGGSVDVEFLDSAGSVLSRRGGMAIEGFGLLELQDAAVPSAAAARVLNASGSPARLAAYALVSDAGTGDSWLVTDPAADAASDTFFVPLLSAGTGAQTRVFLTSRTSASVSVTTETRGGGRRRASGSPANASGVTTITLQPSQTTMIDLSGVTSGLLKLSASPQAISIAARSTRAGGAGSLGASLPAVAGSAALRNGERKRFAGVEDASRASRADAVPATFRSNLALMETLNAGVTVRVTLQFSLGSSSALASAQGRASREFVLAASQLLVLTDLARQVIGPSRDSIGDLRNMLLDVEVISGNGRVIPFLQAFDNGSGDMIVRVD